MWPGETMTASGRDGVAGAEPIWGIGARTRTPAAASRQVRHRARNRLRAACPEPAPAATRAGRACRGAPATASTSAHGARLDDAAGVHDRDAIGRARDDAEVVRDEQQRQAGLPAHGHEQIEDLRLERRVQCRGRLVSDDQRRPACDGGRDEHALAHAAGKLVGIVAGAARRLRDADGVEQFDRPRPRGRSPARRRGLRAPRRSARRR